MIAHSRLRLFKRAAAASLAAIALMLGVSALVNSASANVNAIYSQPVGDCVVRTKLYFDSGHMRSGADAPCQNRHSYTTLTVYLKRDGNVISSPSTTWTNSYGVSGSVLYSA